MLLRKLAFFMMALLMGTAASAAPPSESSVDELLKVTQAQTLLESMTANIEAQLAQTTEQMVGDMPLDAATRQKLHEMQQKSAQILRDEMAWIQMRPVYVQIYRESLTQEELDGMLAFYKTPAGQAMLKKMPVIMQKSMEITQAEIMPRVMQRMQKLRDEYMPAMVKSEAASGCKARKGKAACKTK